MGDLGGGSEGACTVLRCSCFGGSLLSRIGAISAISMDSYISSCIGSTKRKMKENI